MSWLKYLWATLIGFVVTVAIATSSATLILWLNLSRYEERSCANQQYPMTTCGAWAGIGYGIRVIAVCIFIGLFIGTTVGIAFYRRHLKSNPATVIFKSGQ
jgi:cell division protein FtsX